MSPPLVIKVSRRATAQIEKAAEWWHDNRPAAPGAVREDIARALSLLATQPGLGVPARHAKTKGIRRLTLSRIRYYLYYRVSTGALEVLTCPGIFEPFIPGRRLGWEGVDAAA